MRVHHGSNNTNDGMRVHHGSNNAMFAPQVPLAPTDCVSVRSAAAANRGSERWSHSHSLASTASDTSRRPLRDCSALLLRIHNEIIKTTMTTLMLIL